MKKLYIIAILIGMLSLSGCTRNSDIIATSGSDDTVGRVYGDTEDKSSEDEELNVAGDGDDASSDKLLYVYVCGHVVKPGVYGLDEGKRIYDAIECAGGILEDAAPESLAQAKHIEDGQTIYVPGIGEMASGNDEGMSEDDGLININLADKEELMTLPGIGESKASDIIRYREEHGSFGSVNDLMQITGIKEGVFNKIKDRIKI